MSRMRVGEEQPIEMLINKKEPLSVRFLKVELRKWKPRIAAPRGRKTP